MCIQVSSLLYSWMFLSVIYASAISKEPSTFEKKLEEPKNKGGFFEAFGDLKFEESQQKVFGQERSNGLLLHPTNDRSDSKLSLEYVQFKDLQGQFTESKAEFSDRISEKKLIAFFSTKTFKKQLKSSKNLKNLQKNIDL